MTEDNNNKITRKDFLKKSCTGLITYNFLEKSNAISAEKQETKQSPEGYRILGRTGIKVFPVGYGASRTMEPSLVKAALDKGINFLDTGRSYYNGQNEVMVGKVIKGIREKVIIQSKARVRISKGSQNLKSPEASKRIKNMLESSLNQSLKALQTDYIDILLIHGASDVDVINNEAVMEFFTQTKKKGIIRAYGFSSDSNQIEVVKAANKNNFFEVIMVPYNHKGSYVHMLSGGYKEWDQPALEIELKKAQKNGIGLVGMKTCSAGPYSPDNTIKPSYKDALKWVLNHSYIQTMAVAMGNRKEIEENVQAAV